jgi:hypothetical protein
MTTVRRAMALLALVLVALVVTTGLLLPAPAAASQHASGRFSPDVAAGGSPAASSPWSVAVVYVQAGTATSGCSVQRYYDPGTGQFMSVDPLNELTSAGYSFVEDNPLDGTDPTGKLGIYLEGGGGCIGTGCGQQYGTKDNPDPGPGIGSTLLALVAPHAVAHAVEKAARIVRKVAHFALCGGEGVIPGLPGPGALGHALTESGALAIGVGGTTLGLSIGSGMPPSGRAVGIIVGGAVLVGGVVLLGGGVVALATEC